jgi:hypothetical protein
MHRQAPALRPAIKRHVQLPSHDSNASNSRHLSREVAKDLLSIKSVPVGRRQMTNISRNKSEEFFQYSSSRWLFDEARQHAARYVKFDMVALASATAKAMGKPADAYVRIQKLGEGQFNKAFLMTMDDGTEVVARVPNPNAGLPHLTTASEVATMEFVCSLIPVELIPLVDHRQ